VKGNISDIDDIRLTRLGHRRKNRMELRRESHLESPLFCRCHLYMLELFARGNLFM